MAFVSICGFVLACNLMGVESFIVGVQTPAPASRGVYALHAGKSARGREIVGFFR